MIREETMPIIQALQNARLLCARIHEVTACFDRSGMAYSLAGCIAKHQSISPTLVNSVENDSRPLLV